MFAQKQVLASFSLANGSFSGGGNTLNLSGLRISAEISSVPGQSGSFLDSLVIYGMSLSQMNQLSIIGKQLGSINQNSVTVQAQDGDTQPTTVFEGVVHSAYVDGRDQPQVRFIVTANPGGYHARKPVKPTTRQGAQQASDLASFITQAMGFKFENNNVNAIIRNPYLWGTYISQMRQLMKAADAEWIIDRGTLAIWPKGGSRMTGGTPVVKPPKMIGYPMFSQAQLIVTTYFDPSIVPQGQIQVQSSLTPANGTWKIRQMSTELDGLTPHGRWQSVLTCVTPGQQSSGEQ